MGYSRGTSIKNNKHKNYNIVFGTMDKNNPKSLYIKISAWGNPISKDDENYKIIISKISKRIKSRLFISINSEKFNQHKTMVDVDMRESGIAYNKSSFMSCEITLYQYNNFLLKSDNILNELEKVADDVISTVLLKEKHFKFYKKKIDAKSKLKKLNLKD